MAKRFLITALVTLSLCTMAAPFAMAWTASISVSDSDTSLIATVPRISRGSNGSMHLVYRVKNSSNQWFIRYRLKGSDGNWGPVEQISPFGVTWSERPCVVEDLAGRVHVFYTGRGAGGNNDLYHAIKQSGSWNIYNVTNTDSLGEDYPKAVVDSQGRVHVIYFRTTDLVSNNQGDVVHRIWTNGSWNDEKYLGAISYKVGYAKPSVAIDSSDNIHVVWQPDQFHMSYMKYSGGNWGSEIPIAATANFFSFPEIAAVSPSNIVVVTFDQVTGSSYQLKWTYSTNGGANWSALAYLNDGHYPNLDADGGKAYLVYQGRPSTTGTTYYREWNGSSWTTAAPVAGSTNWQQIPDIGIDTNGIQHVVVDDTVTSGTNSRISYVCNWRDITPPASANGLIALSGTTQVRLDWTNPSDSDFTGVVIRRKTGGYPANVNDGTLVIDKTGTVGAADYTVDSGLSTGTTYYYAVYAYDAGRNYAAPARITSVTAGKANLLSDGLLNSFTNGVASGWNTYKVNDPNNAISFAADTVNFISSPSQGIFGIDGTSLPASGLSAAGIYRTVSGVTPGRVYQFVGYTDIYNSGVTAAGHRYLHNFGINTTGGETPGTPTTDGAIGGAKWMTPSQAMWNDQGWSSVRYGGNLDWTAASYPADSSTISLWAGVTIDNAGAKDATQTRFNVDNCFLFEWDFPANASLVNGGFEGDRVYLQDGQNPANMTDGTDVIPAGWVPCGGGIGQSVYNNWTCLPEAKRSGYLGAELKSRRGNINGGFMQKIACLGGYSQTFGAWVRTSGQDGTVASVGIDPYGGGDINSSNIVWQSTTSSSWTYLSTTAASRAWAVTVFLRTSNANTAGINYHWSYFDDCSYSQGSAVSVGRITGYVRDSTGNAVSGAVVSTDIGGYSTTTASDGSYTLINVMPYTYTVTAAKPVYASQAKAGIAVIQNGSTPCDFALTGPALKDIAGAKARPDGAPVKIVEGVVSAAFDGFFYIEKPDRSIGIKVESPTSVTPGSSVTVSGYMSTSGGERFIADGFIEPGTDR